MPDLGKGGRQDRAAAAAEHQPERADELRNGLAKHGCTPRHDCSRQPYPSAGRCTRADPRWVTGAGPRPAPLGDLDACDHAARDGTCARPSLVPADPTPRIDTLSAAACSNQCDRTRFVGRSPIAQSWAYERGPTKSKQIILQYATICCLTSPSRLGQVNLDITVTPRFEESTVQVRATGVRISATCR